MTKKNEVATVAGDNMPAYMNQEQARGQENVSIDDLTIPRLDVIQALSPQRKKNDPEYIDGAEEGLLFNSVTKELYGTDVQFIPCFFRKEWLVWKDRDAGGGFNGAFSTPQEAQEVCAELGPNHEVMDTAQHFGLIVSDSGVEEVVISMSRSKMRASRQLNTLAKMAGGDRFGSVYQISAVEASSDKGDYYSLGVKRLGYVQSEELYKVGEAMYEAISAGERDVKYEETAGKTDEKEDY